MKNVKVEKDVWKKLHQLRIRKDKKKLSDVIRELIESESEQKV